MQDGIPTRPGRSGPGFREFVGLVAAMMAMNAMSIDVMLPALTAIGHALDVHRENDLQLVIAMYLTGFGIGQLFYGPISDRFGRKPVLLVSIAAYVLFATIVSLAWSFPLLLAGRVLMGFAAAATRVLAVSIVRDCFSGRMMAKVTSLTFMVFLAVPILAPSIGQILLAVTGEWRTTFGVLVLFGLIVGTWSALRLPETLHPEYRRTIDVREIVGAFRVALTTRQSVGYMLVSAIMGSSIFIYIGSVAQIFTDVFHRPNLFPTVFAIAAGGMALGSLINARLVERLGMRMISHTAVIAFIVFAVVDLVAVRAGLESIALFAVLQAALMFSMALATSNVSALAMEPLGRIAGTAASLQGFVVTLMNVGIGLAVTQQFDGSVEPIIVGYLLVGVGSLAAILVTERGALFRAKPVAA